MREQVVWAGMWALELNWSSVRLIRFRVPREALPRQW
jgi:hypothetical protein